MPIAAGGTTTIPANTTVTLATIVPPNPTTDVAWVGAIGTDAAPGAQVAPDGGSLAPGITDGVVIVQQETGNANEIAFRATNRNTISARTIRWKVFTG